MLTPLSIILIVGAILESFAIAGLIICTASNNKAYCYLFQHKDWKLWETICKVLPDAVFAGHYTYKENPELDSYLFHIYTSETRPPVQIVYWENRGTISVHYAGECLLSDFDKYHVKKARKILKPMLLNR